MLKTQICITHPQCVNMGCCSNLYCPEQMILNPLLDATSGEMIIVGASWVACMCARALVMHSCWRLRWWSYFAEGDYYE